MTILKKGYTVIVDSWENDGDFKNRNSVLVSSKQEAEDLKKFALGFRSKNDKRSEYPEYPKFGNLIDEPDHKDIINFMKNLNLSKGLKDQEMIELFDDRIYYYSDKIIGNPNSNMQSCNNI